MLIYFRMVAANIYIPFEGAFKRNLGLCWNPRVASAKLRAQCRSSKRQVEPVVASIWANVAGRSWTVCPHVALKQEGVYNVYMYMRTCICKHVTLYVAKPWECIRLPHFSALTTLHSTRVTGLSTKSCMPRAWQIA